MSLKSDIINELEFKKSCTKHLLRSIYESDEVEYFKEAELWEQQLIDLEKEIEDIKTGRVNYKDYKYIVEGYYLNHGHIEDLYI